MPFRVYAEGGPQMSAAPKLPSASGSAVLAERFLTAGTAAFATRGFNATTTREIATLAGVSPGALYVHYPSKEDLLYKIVRVAQESVLDELAAIEGKDPRERIAALVRCFVLWHVRNHELARVSHYELTNLSAEHAEVITEHRRSINALFRDAIHAAEPAMSYEDVRMTSTAIQSMCIDIARWYTTDDAHSAESLADFYSAAAVKLVQPSRS